MLGKFQQLASWLHSKVEPICHLDDDNCLSFKEINEVMRIQYDPLLIPSVGGTANLTREKYSEWLLNAKSHGFSPTEDQERIARGRLTGLNRIGIASWKIFSFGTECQCCWGYRALFIATVWFLFGLFIGVMI